MELELYKRLKKIKNKINKNTMLCIKAQIKRGEFKEASKGIGKYEKYNKFMEIIYYNEQIRLLEKKVKELETERKPLIDLKNKYLSDLRGKNLEVGRLKKKVDELEETIVNLYEKLENKDIYKLDLNDMNIIYKGDEK